MKIHPLWLFCILIRLILVYVIQYIEVIPYLNKYFVCLLLLIGIGFLYKGFTGSNNEIQLSKVFWHETRYIHGVIYILASIYLFDNNYNVSSLLLLSDVLFSIVYRFNDIIM